MASKWNAIFGYNPETGDLRWKVKPSKRVRCGDLAGCKTADGYLQVKYKKEQYPAHRIMYEMIYGSIPVGMEIDHINGEKYDNRISNLRLATISENRRNKSMQCNNTSGFPGVYWNKAANKWNAYLSVANKDIHLGSFTDKADAIAARIAGEDLYHGEFAQHKCGTMLAGTH